MVRGAGAGAGRRAGGRARRGGGGEAAASAGNWAGRLRVSLQPATKSAATTAPTSRSGAGRAPTDRGGGYSLDVIKEGNKAPAFKLPASTGNTVSLSDFKDRMVVLYFYPRDNTPGCTTEARDFQAALGDFAAEGATVLGVSKDSIASHCKFVDKLGLEFPLLSDPDGTVLEKYGAWGEKKMYGKTSMGIIRSTVVIGPDGKVVKHFPKVRVKGHVDKVLEVVREVASASA